MTINNWYDKKSVLLINLILVEVFLIVVVNSFITFHLDKQLSFSPAFLTGSTMLIAVVAVVISFFLLREIIRLAEKEKEAEINEILLADSKETIDILRVHRHDFMNHIQVIYGLLQLKKQETAEEYVREVIGGIQTETGVTKIENPVLAALFIKKSVHAEQMGVKLSIRLDSQLKGLWVSFSDISRIVGNLLDNAIHAADLETRGERRVEIRLSETETMFKISVCNSGAPIPELLRIRIFEKGFSTKEEEGHGLGLHIVNNLVGKNRGNIDLSSEASGTSFVVSFPKVTGKYGV